MHCGSPSSPSRPVSANKSPSLSSPSPHSGVDDGGSTTGVGSGVGVGGGVGSTTMGVGSGVGFGGGVGSTTGVGAGVAVAGGGDEGDGVGAGFEDGVTDGGGVGPGSRVEGLVGDVGGRNTDPPVTRAGMVPNVVGGRLTAAAVPSRNGAAVRAGGAVGVGDGVAGAPSASWRTGMSSSTGPAPVEPATPPPDAPASRTAGMPPRAGSGPPTISETPAATAAASAAAPTAAAIRLIPRSRAPESVEAMAYWILINGKARGEGSREYTDSRTRAVSAGLRPPSRAPCRATAT